MLPLGIGVMWVGYVLTYFGWESLQGPGVGVLDLVIPGRFKGFAKAGSSSTSAGPPVGNTYPGNTPGPGGHYTGPGGITTPNPAPGGLYTGPGGISSPFPPAGPLG